MAYYNLDEMYQAPVRDTDNRQCQPVTWRETRGSPTSAQALCGQTISHCSTTSGTSSTQWPHGAEKAKVKTGGGGAAEEAEICWDRN